jgi:phosphoribosylanthranilate isomerase
LPPSAPTRIKICGITRLEDAVVARSGAHALGLNFAAISPRRVALPEAARISSAVAGTLTRVGIFVDPEPDEVRRVLDAVEIDVLQFHGSEPDSFCAGFGRPYMKAHRVAARVDAAALLRDYPGACGHLLDAYVAGQPGGTGQLFDWRFWPAASGLRLVLAGGLTPDNVAAAIRSIHPYAVDVSGGVEAGRKGIKDPERIESFVAAVQAADREEV